MIKSDCTGLCIAIDTAIFFSIWYFDVSFLPVYFCMYIFMRPSVGWGRGGGTRNRMRIKGTGTGIFVMEVRYYFIKKTCVYCVFSERVGWQKFLVTWTTSHRTHQCCTKSNDWTAEAELQKLLFVKSCWQFRDTLYFLMWEWCIKQQDNLQNKENWDSEVFWGRGT